MSALDKLENLFAFPFYAWSSEQSELQELQQHQQRYESVSASRSSSPGTTAIINNQSIGTLATIATETEWASRLRKISSQDYDEEFLKEVSPSIESAPLYIVCGCGCDSCCLWMGTARHA